MPSPLSTDLRERVVAAVQEGGSRHGAAERFGVSAASASRWHGQFVRDGDITPKPQGAISTVYAADGTRLGFISSDVLRRAGGGAAIADIVKKATSRPSRRAGTSARTRSRPMPI